MNSPFSLKIIADPAAFCNRSEEISSLIRYAESKTNVVIFSPRRYGKTSLARIVQAKLKENGMITVFVDLFGLSSVDNIAGRIAKGVYQALYPQKSIMQKAIGAIRTFRPVIRPSEKGISLSVESASPTLFGTELLEKTMEDLGDFIRKTKKPVHIVLDEFQEITQVGDTVVESVLRAHIQEHEASYFFIGSRRRVLLDMFTQKRRPFFQSAVNFELGVLPHPDLVAFILKKFASGGKICSKPLAQKLAAAVSNHPYYFQKFALMVFHLHGKEVTEASLKEGFRLLLESESYVFEATLQGLSPQQIAVLKAIAREPTASILSGTFMKKHDLKSVGGVQAALRKLATLDHIEKTPDGVWKVVDPVFSIWLSQGIE
jgi:hypothetical protein